MSKLSHSDEETMDDIELDRLLRDEDGFKLHHNPKNRTIEKEGECLACGQIMYLKNIMFHKCGETP